MRPTSADRIDHILIAIDDIRRIVAGHTRESFANDLAIRLAVERLLEIISEASRFIPIDLKAQEPRINWRALADLGNWLRHAYHRTDADLPWSMVEDDLEPLKNFAEQIAKEAKP
ncbi:MULTISPECIES: HepT-like ribonuclease domain-containing protein [unclassified Bradyrhizobium]